MKKLAMIGCGGIGRYHLGHFVNFKDIELAGFCDLLIERAEEFVQIAGSGKAYSDFVKMYDEVKPDMVFICIPPSTHGYIEFETIRRGIPFFVEKPVALDISLANAINDEIKALGEENFFHKDYEATLVDTYGTDYENSLVVEGGVTSAN